MKKFMLSVTTMALMSLATGCLTSATALTEKTLSDGTKTKSMVKIFGTGDKASQIAAEGMQADGTDADFSAGVRNATAEQKSTGIDGTFKGLADFMLGAAQFAQAIQSAKLAANVPITSPLVTTTSEPEPEAISEAPETTSTLPTEESVGVSLKAKMAKAKSTGKPLVVIAGNTGCGYCTTLDSLLNASPEFTSSSDIILYRETSPWSTNKAAKWTGNGKFPVLRVTQWDKDGKILCDKRVNRPMSIAAIEAAIGNCYAK